jgi:transcription initiation factor IIE alpha subunit
MQDIRPDSGLGCILSICADLIDYSAQDYHLKSTNCIYYLLFPLKLERSIRGEFTGISDTLERRIETNAGQIYYEFRRYSRFDGE